MTLVLATLSSRGAVLAADRRSTIRANDSGELVVLSDTANKIAIGTNIAFATFGKNKASATGRDAIAAWLRDTYDESHSPLPQLQQLHRDIFTDEQYGGFAAVWFKDGASHYFTTGFDDKPAETVSYDKVGGARIMMNGSTDAIEVATKISDLWRPPLGAFDIEEMAAYSKFLIETAGGVSRFSKKRVPTVNDAAIIAIVDEVGARIV